MELKQTSHRQKSKTAVACYAGSLSSKERIVSCCAGTASRDWRSGRYRRDCSRFQVLKSFICSQLTAANHHQGLGAKGKQPEKNILALGGVSETFGLALLDWHDMKRLNTE